MPKEANVNDVTAEEASIRYELKPLDANYPYIYGLYRGETRVGNIALSIPCQRDQRETTAEIEAFIAIAIAHQKKCMIWESKENEKRRQS